MKKNKKYFIWGAIVFIVILSVLAVLIATGHLKLKLPFQKGEEQKGARLIEENLTIPETGPISGNEGRIVNTSAHDVPMVPKNEGEKVIIPNAVYSLKNAYDAANNEIKNWSEDARLVFIKSLGSVNIDGKSSEWQVVFNSVNKKKDYEIVFIGDKIVSKKEIDSNTPTFDLPINWFDSDGAIKSLQLLPQFSDATLSSLSFYYDTDSKMWMYALNTSKGATSIPVK